MRVLVASLLLFFACVPVPPGLPPQSNEIVYVDAGPVEVAPAGPSEEERARIRQEVAQRRAAALDGGLVEQPPDGNDPLRGSYTIEEATASLPGAGRLVATIDTSAGRITCDLWEDKAPNTVANFIGLANGTRPFKAGRAWMKEPYYDGTTFHRVIKGFMIQGGDRNGNGTGEPGYVIPDEIWPGAKHDRAGLLCMANRGKDTNGAQFFITDAAVPGLDGNYTIFGVCAPTSIVHAIATTPRDSGDRPMSPVVIDRVVVTREAS
ncbi:MAG: peptidylprolyl isomerase [Labilithrix sp.]|nr:peptidylprolyl isomerase [Labilithrix sp.]MCW5812350.1 peptidylprolyl isomerase [Labilithrix sp.]